MAPVKPGAYEFNVKSIADVRGRLKMKQSKMAELLGVPANTLSRWETGATTPDASSLAGIYSISQEHGVPVNFFKKSATPPPAARQRLRVAVLSDFQNAPVSEKDVVKFDKHVRDEVKSRFPNPSHTLFKAFIGPNQPAQALQQKGWRVKQGRADLDKDIIQHAKAYCGDSPEKTSLVIITKDGDFAGLANELKGKGVQVYLMSPPNPSQKLLSVIDQKHRIRWPG